jgi:hypothetical protein
MSILNFTKGFSKPAPKVNLSNIEGKIVAQQLIQFSYQDKYKLSFDNSLVFTGRLLNPNDTIEIGKNITIPLSAKHSAFTLKINGQPWQTAQGVSSIVIKFKSEEEREIIAGCDFSKEIFYIEK